MTNGRKNTEKVTWIEFQHWQSWDEFPEKKSNPPLTVDVSFLYKGMEYFIIYAYEKYRIYNDKWVSLYEDDNFLHLLTKPIDLFENKSFAEVIETLDFYV